MFKNERLRESSRMIVMMKERKDVSKMFGRNMYAKKKHVKRKEQHVERVYQECIEIVLRVYRECIESVSRVY